MPIQLRLIAILLAVCFLWFTVHLIKKEQAEIRQMSKWLVLSLILVIGALFPEVGTQIAKFFGISTLTSLALYALTSILIVFSLTTQLNLIKSERQIKTLTQELSLLKKEVKDLEKKD
jgi:hypothetical protein